MKSEDILKFCLNKGLLINKEILNLFSETEDLEGVKLVLEKIKQNTQQTIITKNIFFKNKEKVNKIFLDLPEKNQKNLEKLKINLGLSIEIFKEENIVENSSNNLININKNLGKVKILSPPIVPGRKLRVRDFIEYFKKRFLEMRDILQTHNQLNNLVSINKISGSRQGISIIGMVSDKKITKNKNILLNVEDLTGNIKVLVNQNNEKLCKKAGDIVLDSVIGFNVSGNREIVFVNDIIFPDSMVLERKKSPVEEYALFIGDFHFGSKLFLEENFLKFIDYLNGKIPNTPEVEKIKYIFIVGDLITGVGNYPNQEADLKIIDIEDQFIKIAKLLGKIRSDIKIIISPGNHDGVRLMEPQPLFDEKYAWPLYNLKNVVLTGNPCKLNIGEQRGFSGFDVLTYHGFSFPYYAKNVSKLILKKSMNAPEQIMKYLLQQRHLAPTHTSTQYFPCEDQLIIKTVPDIFVSGHSHVSAVSYYNNILVISVSSWESFTPYQEKFGNTPDYCKVPMFNLKTREVKILDFE